jgi:hypothetical protein
VIADPAETAEISSAMQWFVVAARSSTAMVAGRAIQLLLVLSNYINLEM